MYADLPGFHLSGLGKLQAKETARYLSSRPVVAIWSSPLERAIETAQAIAARHQLSVRVDERLTEWAQASRWAGLCWDDLPDVVPGELEAYLSHPWDLAFASETLAESAERVAEVAAELNERHPDGDVVIVGHQDPTQAARLHLTGADPRGQHNGKPGHAAVISLRAGTPWRELTVWEPGEP